VSRVGCPSLTSSIEGGPDSAQSKDNAFTVTFATTRTLVRVFYLPVTFQPLTRLEDVLESNYSPDTSLLFSYSQTVTRPLRRSQTANLRKGELPEQLRQMKTDGVLTQDTEGGR
jgi:hypothetical protein